MTMTGGGALIRDSAGRWSVPGCQGARWRAGRALLVVGRCLLGGLEHFGVVAIEDTGALGVADVADLRIAVVHALWAPRPRNRRDQVLLQTLLEIHDVAGQHDRSRLRQPHDRELAARSVAWRPDDLDAPIVE